MDAVPRELRIAYIQSAPSKLSTLNSLWDTALATGWDAQAREGLVELTHRIAGSGGSYGYPDLSTEARHLELMLKALDAAPADVSPLEQAREALAAELTAVAESNAD